MDRLGKMLEKWLKNSDTTQIIKITHMMIEGGGLLQGRAQLGPRGSILFSALPSLSDGGLGMPSPSKLHQDPGQAAALPQPTDRSNRPPSEPPWGDRGHSSRLPDLFNRPHPNMGRGSGS